MSPDARHVARLFAANLRRCRKRADLSQEEVSIRASLHRTEVSQLERAMRLPRLDTVIKVAGGLDVEVVELLRGIDWQPGTITAGQFRAGPPERSTSTPAR